MKMGGDWIELTLSNREIQFQSYVHQTAFFFRTEIPKKCHDKMAEEMTVGRTCRKWTPQPMQ